MKNSALAIVLAAVAQVSGGLAADDPGRFTLDANFLVPPQGMTSIGDSHGDIAVSPAGEIYVSVEGGEHKGIQVYTKQGQYLRNVPQAPSDLHGFVIAQAPDGTPHIFGASLRGQQIVQMTLEGKPVLSIPASAIPEKYKKREAGRSTVSLTGVAVAHNGDIYAVDGYGLNFIHRFDKIGRYIATFGGSTPPWGFKTCHKIAMDMRFSPTRLLCADRRNGRLVHMDLEGRVMGVFATGLRYPSAMATHQDELAVAELDGRVTILNRQGKISALLGANENAGETRTNRVSPETWQSGRFYAPHGIMYTAEGDLLVTEWNQWGRVVRMNRTGNR